MHYLIDGHNLISALSTISLDDPDDEAKFIIQLRRWTAAGRNRRATVFFDGGLPGGQNARLSSSKVSVVFASAGTPADHRIIGQIKKIHNSGEYVLISSDRQIVAVAVKKKVRSISAAAFANQLKALDKAPARDEDIEDFKAENSSPSEEEISEWLELFNNRDDKTP